MLAIVYIVAFVGGFSGSLIYWHWATHGILSWVHVSLALFCVINVMINVWEVALLVHIDRIKRRSVGFLKTLERGKLPAPLFLFDHMPLRTALSLEGWSEIWVVYSLMDESYADSKSFGWLIDTGNGLSSILPSILWCVCMTWHALLPARIVGIIGVASFWQMAYGTFLYFAQYCYHKRWENHGNSLTHMFLLVLCSNITWIVFPFLGIWSASKMILAEGGEPNAYSVFL